MKTTGNFCGGAAERCRTQSADQRLTPECGPNIPIEAKAEFSAAPAPKFYATDYYRWCQHPDGRLQLQRGWLGENGKQEWRIAPAGSPEPPKIADSEAEWIED